MYNQKSFKGNTVYGNLYLVPTPIGNLEDMSYRSVRMLQEADLIASEDTRNTQKLLNHFEIHTPQKSLHEHNYKERVPQLIALLKEGKTIAQVSDAGMPSISDPGHELVLACIKEGISVISIPGPTAGMTALIASGLVPQPFLFYGFLPRKKKEQKETLEKLKEQTATLIFYESPYRITATLTNFLDIFGNRQVVLCRELTKIHEEYLRGSTEELLAYIEEHPVKGECCLLVEGNLFETTGTEVDEEQGSLKEQVEAKIASGEKPNAAIKAVALKNGLKKQEVYRQYHELD
ncbi:16S rRNA (cytidine(1402)-2'-O)-methyltransferase [Enterococcus faecium]|uniref:Ribosomal RNA small subunit methyltransferase I n=1 Tax=Enterococcus faecium TaxID=1352 RepID=A0A242BKJ9_ENTFC|nr:16S rRNA (cytidine(1402)-2'-O)-methyltransferase [Enterococcus faecium]EGP5688280.1 16S rRNA (cytidine(1402)-2'-O)-methyltransferase [Enterococcus faecium]EME8086241.1 16S rRNA (cytidine(1402)-2'-O)-methyltransferase [Enterococcus faecium]EME8198363.1 16S rRNA (cytidine(1402)-2'-O)-methyltransferase [Enterococcus faecium]KAA0691724.1 16S rRNA (cytidine(1402)-2'-O)-methyltransferase [Enterococcus faecium]MBK5027147.1 16S rRNA (cytidine(1402)-2'-O)-methyltransferase [Enterococcus faecium]